MISPSNALLLILCVAIIPQWPAQQAGTLKTEGGPTMTLTECTKAGGCVSKEAGLVLDANWRWIHTTEGYKNCYTGNAFDPDVCSDPDACAQNCAVEAVDAEGYESTYGITPIPGGVKLDFLTGANVGSRLFMLDDDGESYKVFKLKNREFALDVDVSHVFCGMNGAMYFVEMEKKGGLGLGNNQAGAAYGTGYCDAQCPHDIKFVNGKANPEWGPNLKDFSGNMGNGHYGACCAEMDIWEANSMANAYTPHPCDLDTPGQYACEGIACGDNDAGERYKGVCDKDGCDINPFRNGNYTFYGRGPEFTINTLKPMTVVTQFLTNDGTDDGDLSEIRRFYVQDGKTIHSPPIKILPSSPDSITDESCAAMKELFNNTNDFKAKGGNAEMGRSLDRGHVAVFSLWDDVDVSMMWLDSSYPTDLPSTNPGVKRGECPGGDDSTPQTVRSKYGSTGYVSFANVAVGEIGTTQSSLATTSLPVTQTATSSSSTTTISSTVTQTATTSTTISSTFEPVDGGANRACRGASSGDNSDTYYVVHMGVFLLDDCKTKCVETEGCQGIEHNSDADGRCEVWTRSGGIQDSVPVLGYTCLRYSSLGFPTGSFVPVDSGTDRACRGANSGDNSDSYYIVHTGVLPLDDCKTKCIEKDACQGIEHNLDGRCEVWMRSEGIQASAPVSGYTCLRYSTSATGNFVPVDSGTDRACRGANSGDNSDSYYIIHTGVLLLDHCKTKCVETEGCQGIEHNSDGRCEVWTRSEGIQASAPVSGYNCFRYSTSTSSTASTSTSTPSPSSTSTSTPSPTSTSASTPSPTPTSTEPSGECVEAWGKCGGNSYLGPVCCVSDYSCEFQSQWYSQCKPTSSLLEGGSSRQGRRGSKSRRHHFMGPALIQSSARIVQQPVAEANYLMQEL